MIPGRIENATHTFGKPEKWDDEKGACMSLPVRLTNTPHGPAMLSAWLPQPEEIEALRGGGAVILEIMGDVHPPVSLGVTEPADDPATMELIDKAKALAKRQRHIDKVRAILGHHHASSCKTSAFDRDDGPCDCGAENKAIQIVDYFERVEREG